ncbi:hypothetical protein Tco_0523844 [Tanacetum coccineum]
MSRSVIYHIDKFIKVFSLLQHKGSSLEWQEYGLIGGDSTLGRCVSWCSGNGEELGAPHALPPHHHSLWSCRIVGRVPHHPHGSSFGSDREFFTVESAKSKTTLFLHGSTERYHPNRAITYETCRDKSGWTVSCSQLAVGHPVDHPSSNYFSLDDSARDSSSDSSSKESSDFHSYASSDSSSGHSLSYHSSPDLSSTSAGPSRKTRRSPMMSLPALPLVSGALSLVRANLAKIDECIAYVDALRDRGIDARVVVEAVDQDKTEMGVRGPVEGHELKNGDSMITHKLSQSIVYRLLRKFRERRDNRLFGVKIIVPAFELRGLLSWRGIPGGLEAPRVLRIEKMVTRRVAEEIEAREIAMNLEPLNENGDEQEGWNGGNGNVGNGNGGNGRNGNGGNEGICK